MRSKLSKKLILELYSKIISGIVGIESFVLIFVEIPNKYRFLATLVNVFIFAVVFVLVLIYSYKLKQIKIDLCGTCVTIKFGDMFSENGNKVISCNEYFDSKVDNVLISENTLNGRVIKTYITDIADFDEKIKNDSGCNAAIVGSNPTKALGKLIKYKLGTCFKYDQFIFVAFTKFNDRYQAYLNLPDYYFTLANFWEELNRVYNAEDVVIPLMGSGITRLGNNSITKEQQLQILIDSLKYSNLSFAHNSKITIVLSENLKDQIRLFNIR